MVLNKICAIRQETYRETFSRFPTFVFSFSDISEDKDTEAQSIEAFIGIKKVIDKSFLLESSSISTGATNIQEILTLNSLDGHNFRIMIVCDFEEKKIKIYMTEKDIRSNIFGYLAETLAHALSSTAKGRDYIRLPLLIRKLSETIELVPPYFLKTLALDTNFQPLFNPHGNIYVTGSGASSHQAQFLASLMQKYLGLPASFVYPYSLKTKGSPKPGETIIFFSQKLSDNTKEAVEHYRSIGVNVVIFTARGSHGLPPEVQVYNFLPYHSYKYGEKTTIPVVGPISSYLQILKYLQFLMASLGIPHSNFLDDSAKIYGYLTESQTTFASIAQALDFDHDEMLDKRPIIIIGSGINMAAVNHSALVLTEGALMQTHGYEIENYTHGLRFADWGQPRTYIVFTNPDNKSFYEAVYPKSIFTEGHRVIEVYSTLGEQFRLFEYMMFSFHLLLYLTKRKKININNYPGKSDPGAQIVHRIIY